ncbi:MAG: twin-arginine translocation signal domain-containing protein [Thiogranum sp.]
MPYFDRVVYCKKLVQRSLATAGARQGSNASKIPGRIIERGQHEHNQPDRRQFLRGTAAGGAGANCAAQTSACGGHRGENSVEMRGTDMDNRYTRTNKRDSAAFSFQDASVDIARIQRFVFNCNQIYQAPYELLAGEAFHVTQDLPRREKGG